MFLINLVEMHVVDIMLVIFNENSQSDVHITSQPWYSMTTSYHVRLSQSELQESLCVPTLTFLSPAGQSGQFDHYILEGISTNYQKKIYSLTFHRKSMNLQSTR